MSTGRLIACRFAEAFTDFSNSLVGAVGATAGPDGSAWTVVRGPDDKVYRQKL